VIRRGARLALLSAVLLLLPAVPARAEETGLAYRADVAVTGGEEGLKPLIEQSSTLIGLQSNPPLTEFGLRQRIEADTRRIDTILRSEGYYSGGLSVAREEGEDGVLRLHIRVDPGPDYVFGPVTITRPPDGPDGLTADALGLVAGRRARAAVVAAASDYLLESYDRAGYPFAEITERRAVVDHDLHEMRVSFEIDPGAKAVFGPVSWEGMENFDPARFPGRILVAEGAPYQAEALEETRNKLAELGIFDSVSVTPDLSSGRLDGIVPVTIALSERKLRFVGGGARFSTADGAGLSLHWGRRNLFGGAEEFRIYGEGERIGSSLQSYPDITLGSSLSKPDFLDDSQTLVLTTELVREYPDAFDRNAVTATAILERPLTDNLVLSYGVGAEYSRTSDRYGPDAQRLVWLPVTLGFDGRDDALDPARGFRVDLSTALAAGLIGSDVDYLSLRLGLSAYRQILADRRLILAGRFAVGTVISPEFQSLPPDRRFYAGGGGSVRGYAFQSVGPVDAEGNPTGGKSLFEGSLEARLRLSDKWGLVPFLDAGQVSPTVIPLPFTGEQIDYAAGLGLRYYSSFGPIRLDVATPLHRRDQDGLFQIYLSIGQAF
jgi:translocation and assembly module TamA